MTDKLTVSDCRQVGFCAAGVRRRCNDLGFDPRVMFAEGLPLEALRHVDDSQLAKAIIVAETRIAGES
jgi:hypothetical protein